LVVLWVLIVLVRCLGLDDSGPSLSDMTVIYLVCCFSSVGYVSSWDISILFSRFLRRFFLLPLFLSDPSTPHPARLSSTCSKPFLPRRPSKITSYKHGRPSKWALSLLSNRNLKIQSTIAPQPWLPWRPSGQNSTSGTSRPSVASSFVDVAYSIVSSFRTDRAC
jgi:hypothetical protein